MRYIEEETLNTNGEEDGAIGQPSLSDNQKSLDDGIRTTVDRVMHASISVTALVHAQY